MQLNWESADFPFHKSAWNGVTHDFQITDVSEIAKWGKTHIAGFPKNFDFDDGDSDDDGHEE